MRMRIFCKGGNLVEAIDKIVELRKQIYQIQFDQWTKETLFSVEWWIILATAIAFWVIWWILLDKKRFNEIALAGFVAAVMNFILNTTGVEMTLWAYPKQIFGLVRTWSVFELSFITVSYMLVYQYFKDWKKYMIAVTPYVRIVDVETNGKYP